MPRTPPISQEIWTLFVLVVIAIAIGGSVVIAFLTNLLLLILSFVLLIILIIIGVWFIKNQMDEGGSA